MGSLAILSLCCSERDKDEEEEKKSGDFDSSIVNTNNERKTHIRKKSTSVKESLDTVSNKESFLTTRSTHSSRRNHANKLVEFIEN